MYVTSKLAHALLKMCPQCNTHSLSHTRTLCLWLWPLRSEIPGVTTSPQNRFTPQSFSGWCRTDYTFMRRWKRKLLDKRANNKTRPRFILLLSKFLFSHGPLGVPLPVFEPFPKVVTEYFISFSEKLSSRLVFSIQGISWFEYPGEPAFF